MKKLLILVTLISSFMISSVAHADWTKVSENMMGAIFYIDLERIRKRDGRVYYWALVDNLKPTKYGDFSWKSYNEAECGRFKYRVLTRQYYTEPMGEGTPSAIDKNQRDWTYPSPNAVDEAILKLVCNHKTMQ